MLRAVVQVGRRASAETRKCRNRTLPAHETKKTKNTMTAEKIQALLEKKFAGEPFKSA